MAVCDHLLLLNLYISALCYYFLLDFKYKREWLNDCRPTLIKAHLLIHKRKNVINLIIGLKILMSMLIPIKIIEMSIILTQGIKYRSRVDAAKQHKKVGSNLTSIYITYKITLSHLLYIVCHSIQMHQNKVNVTKSKNVFYL